MHGSRTLFAVIALVSYQYAAASGAVPEIFGEGVISTPDDEFGAAFTPDGNTVYFTKRSPTTNTPPRSVICFSRRTGVRWSEPQVAPFSGVSNDFGITISADGQRILFSSDRTDARAPKDAPPNIDIWTVDFIDGRWSDARNLGVPINTAASEAYPSLAADGTLYFSSSRQGGKGSADLYRAHWIDGKFAEPENIADINTPGYESQPAIAPDQHFIVFTAFDRSDTLKTGGAPYSRSDLYVSFKTPSGWAAPLHFDAPINSPFNESNASVSPDGQWLYFASDRSFVSIPMPRGVTTKQYSEGLRGLLDGWNNIYRVPVAAVEAFQPNANSGASAP